MARPAPVDVSLGDKFARGESQDSAIPFTNLESSFDQPFRYPRILWI